MKIGDIVKMKGPDGDIGFVIEADNRTGFTKVVWLGVPSLCATSHLILVEDVSQQSETDSSIFS